MSSPIHKASLVPAAVHSQALLELVDQKLSRPIIEYLIDSVVETVDFALGRPSHSARGRSLSRRSEGSAFTTMVNNVVTRAEVELPVILATLVYLERAKPHLHIALEEWANERVFLGALIVASKYLNDSTLKNVHWAVCTGVFGKRDVGRIEREFLDVLDFELSITEDDIMAHHDSIMALVFPAHRRSHGITNVPLPQLSYPSGSPSSTEASLSPRTPTDAITIALDTHPKAEHHHSHHEAYPVVPVPEPAHVSQPRHEKRQSHSSSTFRILRSIPFSRPFSHFTSSSSSSSSSSESEAPQQISAQQARCQLIPPFAAQPTTQVYA